MNTASFSLGGNTRPTSAFFWIIAVHSIYLFALIIYSFHLVKWGVDGDHHVSGMAELYGPFSKGQFDTYLSPMLAYSRGLPTYIYYSQWLYYPPYLFTTIGFGVMQSFALTYAVIIFVTWLGFYKLARYYVARNFAALGATMLVTCNSFVADIYTRFAYGQAFSYALVPLSFYALHKAMLSNERFTLMLPISVLSTMILAYPLGFMNICPLLLVYCLIILPSKEQFFDFLSKGLIICIATLSVTAFFWLPGLIESDYIVGGDAIGKVYTKYFWTLKTALNFTDPINLGAFLNIALLGAICLHAILFRHLHKATILLACVLFYFFMLTSYSFFLVDLFPILEANFSVNRMLVPLSFAASLYVVIILNAWRKSILASSITLLLCVIMLIQASELIYRYTSIYISPKAFLQTFPEDINTQLAGPIRYSRNLRSGVGVGEFEPNLKLPLPAPIVTEDECQEIAWLPAYVEDIQRQNIVFNYDVDHAGCYIRMSPYWNIRYTAVDDTGQDLTIGIHEESKSIIIKTANKSGTIGLKFSDPKYVRRSKRLSAFAFILMMLFTMKYTAKCQRINVRS